MSLLVVLLLLTACFEISSHLECCSVSTPGDDGDACPPFLTAPPRDALGSCEWRVGLDWRLTSFGFSPLLAFRVSHFGLWNADGQKHGPGVFTSLAGSRYVGSWHADKRHGLGVFISDDGSRWFGLWDSDRLSSPLLPSRDGSGGLDPPSSSSRQSSPFVMMSQEAWRSSLPLEAQKQIASLVIASASVPVSVSVDDREPPMFEIHEQSRKAHCVAKHVVIDPLISLLFERARKDVCCSSHSADLAALEAQMKVEASDAHIGSCFIGSVDDGLMSGEGIVELPFSFWIQGHFEAGFLATTHGSFGLHGSKFHGTISAWRTEISLGSPSLHALVSLPIPSQPLVRCLFHTSPDLPRRPNSDNPIVWELKGVDELIGHKSSEKTQQSEREACLLFSQGSSLSSSLSPLDLLSDLSTLLRWHEYFLLRTNPVVQVSNYQFSAPSPLPSPSP